MSEELLLKVGIIGTVIAALCCFTPVLAVLFGIVGLSALVGYLDVVLLPELSVFVLITLYAVWRKRRQKPYPPKKENHGRLLQHN